MTLEEKLTNKSKDLLSIYCTAGYPQLNSLPVVLKELERCGVDFIEIGIPYSDPISDGTTIQESNQQALDNGISLTRIFEQLKQTSISTPKVLMGYFNSILQFGIERFCEQCAGCGVSGTIIPDLPPEVFETGYRQLFEAHHISMIFLITPETPGERIQEIDRMSSSFIYAVSSSGVTGGKDGISAAENYLQRLNRLNTSHPLLVGFNIKSHDDFKLASVHAQGAIIGSAFIRHIKESPNLSNSIPEFISQITQKPTP